MISSEGSGMHADSIAISSINTAVAGAADHGIDENENDSQKFFSHEMQFRFSVLSKILGNAEFEGLELRTELSVSEI